MVGDLPQGVIYQWARWCKNPHYFVTESGQPLQTGHSKLVVPILAISFTDDELMSWRNIDKMHAFYSNAKIERRHLHPQTIGAKRIGHFGFFRTEFKNSLWQQTLRWLIEVPIRGASYVMPDLIRHPELSLKPEKLDSGSSPE
jgi:predicted alpha/beta hydrolase